MGAVCLFSRDSTTCLIKKQPESVAYFPYMLSYLWVFYVASHYVPFMYIILLSTHFPFILSGPSRYCLQLFLLLDRPLQAYCSCLSLGDSIKTLFSYSTNSLLVLELPTPWFTLESVSRELTWAILLENTTPHHHQNSFSPPTARTPGHLLSSLLFYSSPSHT